jgi:hypothetical protein
MLKNAIYRAKPAYGRTYACQADAMYDWESEKDFKLLEGPYFSKRDFEKMCEDAKYEIIIGSYEYVVEVIFYSTTKAGYDRFFVNTKGVCVLAP